MGENLKIKKSSRDIHSNIYKHFIEDKKANNVLYFAHVAQLVEHFKVSYHASDTNSNLFLGQGSCNWFESNHGR